jgi:hypothetical protein
MAVRHLVDLSVGQFQWYGGRFGHVLTPFREHVSPDVISVASIQ